jgi:hypothetical protein
MRSYPRSSEAPPIHSATARGEFRDVSARVIATIRFSMHLPDDQHIYILDAQGWLGEPKTWIIQEKWRRELPPLPSILDLERRP